MNFYKDASKLTTIEVFVWIISSYCFRDGLKQNGVIIIKENVTSTDDLELDRQDSSVTRSMSLFRQIFDNANLDCYRVVKQQHFPKGLYSVYMFVLKSKVRGQISNNEICPIDNDTTEVNLKEKSVDSNL